MRFVIAAATVMNPFMTNLQTTCLNFTFSTTIEIKNKRRAVAAQTARSRCKFRYALFRDYTHTRASRLLETVDSSIHLTLVKKVEID